MGKSNYKVDVKNCLACGGCISICPQNALSMHGMRALILERKCIGCGICIKICPVKAIYKED
jgi:ferredoxin